MNKGLFWQRPVFIFLCLKPPEIFIQPIKTRFPQITVLFKPHRYIFQRFRLQTAGPPPGIPPPRN